MKSVSIIGPCFNEENNIDEYLLRIIKVSDKLGLDYKIILIDDGSKDNTWSKILEHSKNNNRIKGIKFTRNFGHQAALMAESILQIQIMYFLWEDVDLQDPPELMEQMFEKISSKKFDVVFKKELKIMRIF